MKIIYRTDSGKEFEDREKAFAYEALARVKVSIPVRTTEKEVIPTESLKQIFDIGSVYGMTLLLKNEEGHIYEDSNFETWTLDKTGHLNCTDLNHGLIEWSEEDNTYYWTMFRVSRKVELVGIVDVCYM